MNRRVFLVSLGSFVAVGCRGSGNERPTPVPTSIPSESGTPTPAPPTSAPTAAKPTETPTQPPVISNLEPLGFPLDGDTRTGLVSGAVGARLIRWGEGPTVRDYSRNDQPSSDPDVANRCGWNARTHLEYEGQPAVDWYVPVGRPVLATMDGTATLLINTVSNPFDVYGVSREPYIGNPDRSRAPISPFPGPGGGQGVFVRIENSQYRTDYAHLDITPTVKLVPNGTYFANYSATFDYAKAFSALRDFRTATLIASWEVRKGELIGFTGDSGYSEAPHLHYAIRPAGEMNALCPTTEAGFANGGWLFRE
ncbi:MAG: M23 family metallopeptidase [bacterium]